MRAAVDSSHSTTRALAALPTSTMRQAVLHRRLAHLSPAAAAALIQGLLVSASRCDRSAWPATMALFRWRRDLCHPAAAPRLAAIATAASDAHHAAAHAFCDEAPAHRSLHPLGRLAEVCIPERSSVALPPWWRACWMLQRSPRLLLHPSPILITSLLEQRWVKRREALVIASRRPSSPAIAFTLADNDHWMTHAAVRDALALNPFTPTGLALALLPTLRLPTLTHLRDGGDVHPKLAHAARCFLALRSSSAPPPAPG